MRRRALTLVAATVLYMLLPSVALATTDSAPVPTNSPDLTPVLVVGSIAAIGAVVLCLSRRSLSRR
jgi:hypothetical protein